MSGQRGVYCTVRRRSRQACVDAILADAGGVELCAMLSVIIIVFLLSLSLSLACTDPQQPEPAVELQPPCISLNCGAGTVSAGVPPDSACVHKPASGMGSVSATGAGGAPLEQRVSLRPRSRRPERGTNPRSTRTHAGRRCVSRPGDNFAARRILAAHSEKSGGTARRRAALLRATWETRYGRHRRPSRHRRAGATEPARTEVPTQAARLCRRGRRRGVAASQISDWGSTRRHAAVGFWAPPRVYSG